MDSTPQPQPGTGGAGDFVAVDDSGEFSYYGSREELLGDFEYVGEAPCIIDRSGTSYRLDLDRNRRLCLGPPMGPVEFHWLRQALADARDVHPEMHRLQRAEAAGRADLVAGLFETLQLERGTDPDAGPWSLDIDGLPTRRNTLPDVDAVLAGQDRLETIRVSDPFGHSYRPVWHPRHRYLPHSGFICYVEIPAQNA
ncbi:hypothetical protein [Pseudarthrobacter sp. S9]|uniref:hypothetical protein n=1 Tax=Pseudarthrobacter sp. S9 TaxID=3418421 RepID=UPI003CFF7649